MKLHTYLYQPSQKFYLNGTFFTIKMGGKPTDRKLVSMEIGSGVVCVTYQDFYVRYVQRSEHGISNITNQSKTFPHNLSWQPLA